MSVNSKQARWKRKQYSKKMASVRRQGYIIHSRIKALLTEVKSGFLSLKGSPPELWKCYLLKFFDSYSYFSFSLIFTLFLSSDFGFSDVSAGTLYGAWGALITLFGLLTGVFIDTLGVSKSLRLGFAVSLLARCMIFLTNSRVFLYISVCVLSFGNCLGIPVLTVGIRRYTTESNQGFAFGLFYVVMNIAALLSGPMVDFCTILYKGGNDEDDVGVNEWKFSGYRLVILSGIVANVAACVVSFTIKEINVVESFKHEEEPQAEDCPDHDPESSSVKSFQPTTDGACKILKETIRNKNFWRFLAVCMITLNIRMIFRHLDATLPKYMVREFGENVPKGTVYSINPALIIILVPLITAATNKVDPLVMIHYGSYVSAASVFFLAASTSITSCVLFVTMLSIGEAMWSPRLNDYTMQMCEEGKEGTYMALSSAPLFLVKLPVGFMSGYLLEKYCPEDGPRESRLMWLIIGMTTATSPFLLTFFWSYLSKKDEPGEGQQHIYSPVRKRELVLPETSLEKTMEDKLIA